jgi:hypothetical protein
MAWGPHFAGVVPALAASLIGPLMIFSIWRIRRATIRAGRAAIERLLRQRGETVAQARPAPIVHSRLNTGLTAEAVVFDVLATEHDGAERAYDLAYDPAGGLVKRYAHGIWIAA